MSQMDGIWNCFQFVVDQCRPICRHHEGSRPPPPNNKEENVSIPYINTWLAQSGVQRDTSVFYLVANVVVVSSRVLILANTIPMF